MTALADLRALAEQARADTNDGPRMGPPIAPAIRNFVLAATPAVVLALVEVAEAAQALMRTGGLGDQTALRAALAGLGITAEETSR